MNLRHSYYAYCFEKDEYLLMSLNDLKVITAIFLYCILVHCEHFHISALSTLRIFNRLTKLFVLTTSLVYVCETFIFFTFSHFQLWGIFHRPDRVEYAMNLSLKALQLDYVDLYLMHSPMAFKVRASTSVQLVGQPFMTQTSHLTLLLYFIYNDVDACQYFIKFLRQSESKIMSSSCSSQSPRDCSCLISVPL